MGIGNGDWSRGGACPLKNKKTTIDVDYAELETRAWADAMAEYVPDVKIAADPALMEYWTKDAEPAYDANGALTVWMPS